MAHLSLTAINEYTVGLGEGSLFDNIQLPAGVDKNTLVDRILQQSVDFETIYPEAGYLKYAIRTFFKIWYRTFDKWARALETDYNPLENYDRHEEYTNGSRVKSTTDGTTTNTGLVTAYDSETLKTNDQNQGRDHSDAEGTASGHGNSYIHGNIGVTTSQQMLQAELDVQRFNIYQAITDTFLQEFCILVYG